MNTNIPTVESSIATIKIAIDMHLKSYRVVRQLDFSAPQPAQRFEPAKFYPWLQKQITQARRVVVCYEAGCFGYEPARRMQRLGAEVLVIAPQDWDEQGKRQVNDQFDASVLCRRLSDYLCGHRKALSIVHIPSPEEEARRAQGRLREQLRLHLARMRAMGRSLLLQRELVVKGRWWTSGQLVAHRGADAALGPHAARALEEDHCADRARAGDAGSHPGGGRAEATLCRRRRAQPRADRARTHRSAPLQERPPGRQLLWLMPKRKQQRREAPPGCDHQTCSPRLRRLMIQLAWRVVIFQPQYRGMQRWQSVLGLGVGTASIGPLPASVAAP